MHPLVSARRWRRSPNYRLEPKAPEERRLVPPEEWFIVPATHDEREWVEVDVLRDSKEHPLWLDFVNLAKPLHGFWPVGTAPIERLEDFAQRARDFAGRWGLLGLYDGATAAGDLFGGGDESLWSPDREGRFARALWERGKRVETVPPHHVESVMTWAGLAAELCGILEPILPKEEGEETHHAGGRHDRFRLGDSYPFRSYGKVRLEPVVVRDELTREQSLALRMYFDWLLPAMVYQAVLEAHQDRGRLFQVCGDCRNVFIAQRPNRVYCERCRALYHTRTRKDELGERKEGTSKGSRKGRAFNEMLRRLDLKKSAPPGSDRRKALAEAYRKAGPSGLRQRAREMGLLRA